MVWQAHSRSCIGSCEWLKKSKLRLEGWVSQMSLSAKKKKKNPKPIKLYCHYIARIPKEGWFNHASHAQATPVFLPFHPAHDGWCVGQPARSWSSAHSGKTNFSSGRKTFPKSSKQTPLFVSPARTESHAHTQTNRLARMEPSQWREARAQAHLLQSTQTCKEDCIF